LQILEREVIIGKKTREEVIPKPTPKAFTETATGASMFYVTLQPTFGGSNWTKEIVAKLITKWTGMLRSGSLPSDITNVATATEPRLLVKTEKAWVDVEVMKFVISQPETVKITGANDYTRKDFDMDDGEL